MTDGINGLIARERSGSILPAGGNKLFFLPVLYRKAAFYGASNWPCYA